MECGRLNQESMETRMVQALHSAAPNGLRMLDLLKAIRVPIYQRKTVDGVLDNLISKGTVGVSYAFGVIPEYYAMNMHSATAQVPPACPQTPLNEGPAGKEYTNEKSHRPDSPILGVVHEDPHESADQRHPQLHAYGGGGACVQVTKKRIVSPGTLAKMGTLLAADDLTIDHVREIRQNRCAMANWQHRTKAEVQALYTTPSKGRRRSRRKRNQAGWEIASDDEVREGCWALLQSVYPKPLPTTKLANCLGVSTDQVVGILNHEGKQGRVIKVHGNSWKISSPYGREKCC